MSEHILKRHNKTLILYHIVCPAKYRQKVFTERVELSLKNICIEIGKRYEIYFVEIGTDKDHVHFLVQSVPVLSPSRVVQIIKSITAKVSPPVKNGPSVRRKSDPPNRKELMVASDRMDRSPSLAKFFL